MRRPRLVEKPTNSLLLMKLLTKKVIRVSSLHETRTGRQVVLRLEFDDESVVHISSSKFGMGIGWVIGGA